MPPLSTKRLSIALLVSLVISLVASGLLDKNSTGMVRRGDFPAFYAAAAIVKSGQGSELYSRRFQREIENNYWPALEGNYYAFAYPVPFALYISPIANFRPIPAKLVFLGIQLCFFAVVYLFMKGREPLGQDRPIETLTLLATFAPLFVGVVAGQSAALNLLFLLVCMTIMERGTRWEHDAVLGLVLGMWLYKPQLGLIGLVLACASCRPLAVFSGWLLGALVTWAAGFVVSGPLWPSLWYAQTTSFARADFATNGFQMISLLAVTGELFEHFGLGRSLGQLAGIGGTLFFLAAAFFRASRGFERRRIAALLLGPTMAFCGGHVLFYEAGLILPALFFLTRGDSQGCRLVLANIFAFLCIVFLRESVVAQPLLLLVALVFFWALFQKGNEEEILEPHRELPSRRAKISH